MDPTISEMKIIIANHIDISHSRLKNKEVEFLYQFIMQYDRFQSLDYLYKHCNDNLWSSDGRYTRWYEDYYYFGESEIRIFKNWSFHDDDGQNRNGTTSVEMTARKVIDWFKEHHRLPMFAGVNDIVTILI
ncbi:Hypothetical protein Tcol_210 [Trichococcus collinsii]|uniref:Uncharacterized protein n=2 Tax=Trichococcus collinsii TaxID=157076 RepID=A0AB37ZWP3_9LACT|nr:Hypothetical protein Tcol_210 [Trichococcus collinsii]SDZ87378.1 hypothetical protein SAMN04488525_101469 [Trichococcus collinsii]